MKQKIIKFIHNLGFVTGIFYMLIPFYVLHTIDDNYYNWIFFAATICYGIFFYKKVMKKKEYLDERYKTFIGIFKKRKTIVKLSKEQEYESLLKFTDELFSNLDYNEKKYNDIKKSEIENIFKW